MDRSAVTLSSEPRPGVLTIHLDGNGESMGFLQNISIKILKRPFMISSYFDD
jgi:hypothetical protein